jgi:hemerythrin-like domain-containing protein
VLKRILLIYREYIRRLTADQDSDPAALFHAAQIVHDYIEGFHEGIEEGFVFPRLLAAGKQTSTVRELLTQHDRGRKLTIKIIQASTTMKMASGVPSPGFASVTGRKDLSRVLSQFVAMYEPHEAREDTEVFPGFRSIVSAKEFEDISRQVRKIENSRYGRDALAGFVGAIADIEVSVGINDISLFTPTDN